MAEIDFDARYAVEGYGGVAFWLDKYYEEEVQTEVVDGVDDEGYPAYIYHYDTVTDYERVIAVMVGDDYRHIVDVSDLRKLDDDEYCSGCGQIGHACFGY